VSFKLAKPIHPDLLEAQQRVYEPSKLTVHNPVAETESKEYGAFDFQMNGLRIKFRVAKTTPTKVGQFVTLWKRVDKGPIQPFDQSDPIDFFVISVRHLTHFGQFVFPKAVLLEKGVISKEGVGGKRAMRVYPPWDLCDNKQAKRTQSWQLLYFFEIDLNKIIDIKRVEELFRVD
jgi:hypothetical protein